MKPSYTLAMVAILVALGVYVFAFERGPAPPTGDAKIQPNVVTFEAADLKTLSLEQAGKKVVLTQQKPGSWRVQEPPLGAADSSRIDITVNMVRTWQAMETVDAAYEGKDLAAFGLEQPTLKITLGLARGTQEVWVGAKTPTNSGYYVYAPEQKKLYLSYVNIPEDLGKLVQEPPKATPAPTPMPSASAS
jgi:hypothetical protein